MRWRPLFFKAISLLIFTATTVAVSAETMPRLGLPKEITFNQIVSLKKIKIKWTAPKNAKKYVFKIVEGNSVVLKKTVKKPHITFSEKNLTHKTTYSIRIRAKATSTHSASHWQKKKWTYRDRDLDDDGEVNEDDTDDDNDGILDDEDEFPNDHDNDGITDSEDDDDDNDLAEDIDDEYPLDHDNDGDPDITDPDDDNDGILDVDEAAGQQFDEDNDGIPDYLDEDYIAEHQPMETFTIQIKNNRFVDGDITITVGDIVKWINKDEGGHAVAASDGSFESPPLEMGESYSYTFDTAGTYEYYDPTAPDIVGLSGTITVEE